MASNSNPNRQQQQPQAGHPTPVPIFVLSSPNPIFRTGNRQPVPHYPIMINPNNVVAPNEAPVFHPQQFVLRQELVPLRSPIMNLEIRNPPNNEVSPQLVWNPQYIQVINHNEVASGVSSVQANASVRSGPNSGTACEIHAHSVRPGTSRGPTGQGSPSFQQCVNEETAKRVAAWIEVAYRDYQTKLARKTIRVDRGTQTDNVLPPYEGPSSSFAGVRASGHGAEGNRRVFRSRNDFPPNDAPQLEDDEDIEDVELIEDDSEEEESGGEQGMMLVIEDFDPALLCQQQAGEVSGTPPVPGVQLQRQEQRENGIVQPRDEGRGNANGAGEGGERASRAGEASGSGQGHATSARRGDGAVHDLAESRMANAVMRAVFDAARAAGGRATITFLEEISEGQNGARDNNSRMPRRAQHKNVKRLCVKHRRFGKD